MDSPRDVQRISRRHEAGLKEIQRGVGHLPGGPDSAPDVAEGDGGAQGPQPPEVLLPFLPHVISA